MYADVNAYGTKQEMETVGWSFDWDDKYVMGHPDGQCYSLCCNLPTTSYCGFRHPQDGSISLTLAGSGTVTIDYGNPNTAGTVKLYLNDDVVDTAEANTDHKQAQITFQAGDVLKLTEHEAIIAIHSVSFSCHDVSTVSGCIAGSDRMAGAHQYLWPSLGNAVYRGCLNTTISGLQCQSWGAQTPHAHPYTPNNHPGKGLEDGAYCRMPNDQVPDDHFAPGEKNVAMGIWCTNDKLALP
jgi:hypothetical protein